MSMHHSADKQSDAKTNKLCNNSSHKTLNIWDRYNREALCITVNSKMNSKEVMETFPIYCSKMAHDH